MRKFSILFFPLIAVPSATLSAVEKTVPDSGNTAWMLVATALVMLMTPAGLALFYGGLTRRKNVLNTIGMSLIAFAIGTLTWVVAGYSIAFGDGDLLGSGRILLAGITESTLHEGSTIPEFLFAAFQGTFAAIAVAIASGSMIERVKFSTFSLFAAMWILLVYAPVTHWAWGGGEMLNFEEIDFAGGTVVHINAGIAGFVVAMMLGKRRDYGKSAIKPFSPILVVLGAALLWFGWFGFNAGSQIAADGVAANAFMVTNIAASAGIVGWLALEYMIYKKATLVGGASGAVAGLVAITPASGTSGVGGAVIIGLIGGMLGAIAVSRLKRVFPVDDALDAFWVHGLVGIWGSLATAIFIAPYLSPENYTLSGQLISQIKAVVLTISYSAVMTALVFFIAGLVTGGGRVDDETELIGLDEAVHGEEAINL